MNKSKIPGITIKAIDISVIFVFLMLWSISYFGSAETEIFRPDDVKFRLTNNIRVIPESNTISATGEDPWFILQLGHTAITDVSLTISEAQGNPEPFYLYYIPVKASGSLFKEEWKALPNSIQRNPGTIELAWSFPIPVEFIRLDPPVSKFNLYQLKITSFDKRGLFGYAAAILILYFLFRLCFLLDVQFDKTEDRVRWGWVYIIILSLITIVKIWLTDGQYLTAKGGSGHDDALFIELAKNILTTGWLGEYSKMTLIKGPFYPLYIAFNFLIGFPLLLGQHLLYIGACLLLTFLLYFIFLQPTALLLLYAVLIFSPATFSIGLTRVMRVGIYPALTVLTIDCLIGLYIWRKRSMAGMAGWAIGVGIFFAAFWLTREEGVWLIPSCILLVGFIVFDLWVKNDNRVKRIAIVFSSVGVGLLSILLVSVINYNKYGIFNTVEFKTEEFTSAYGALSRVVPENRIRYVPVTRAVREKIYEVSPSFAELKPYLEGDLGENWAVHGKSLTHLPKEEREIAGGWFMWAFRDAVALAGYHENGSKALKFYARIASEVNAACDDHTLQCISKRASMTPPWRSEYLPVLLDELHTEIPSFLNFKHFPVEYTYSSIVPGGTKQLLEIFEDITMENIAPLPDDNILPMQDRMNRIKINVLHWIYCTYSVFVPVLFFFSFLFYCIQIAISIFYRKLSFLSVLLFAVLFAAVFRFFILLYIHITSFSGMHDLYLAPSYPLFLSFCVLSIIHFFNAPQIQSVFFNNPPPMKEIK